MIKYSISLLTIFLISELIQTPSWKGFCLFLFQTRLERKTIHFRISAFQSTKRGLRGFKVKKCYNQVIKLIWIDFISHSDPSSKQICYNMKPSRTVYYNGAIINTWDERTIHYITYLYVLKTCDHAWIQHKSMYVIQRNR